MAIMKAGIERCQRPGTQHLENRLASAGARSVVVTALCISVLTAAAKLFSLLGSSTSALLASTVHSLIDASCLGLLLLGMWNVSAAPVRPSDSAPDRLLYFWSFVVAIPLYAMGGGIALYEGVERLARPQALVSPASDMLTLALAAAGGALAALMALRELRSSGTSTNPLAAAVHRPSIAPIIAVLVIVAASIAGNVLALGGLLGAANGGDQRSDPLAALAIGLAMSAVAAFMAIEVKRLLIAEPQAAGTSLPSPAVMKPNVDDALEVMADAGTAIETKSITVSEPVAAAVAATAAAAAKAVVKVDTADVAEKSEASKPSGSPQKPSITARQAGRKGRGKRRR